MSFTITDQAVLEAIRQAALAGNWQGAYQAVIDQITTKRFGDNNGGAYSQDVPAAGVDEAVWIWVNGAKNVNSSNGSFATYIREYTKDQYYYRTGNVLVDQQIQRASNNVAANFISQLLYGKPTGNDPNNFARDFAKPAISGLLPDLHTIGGLDAGGAASQVFNLDASSTGERNYSPWAGTVLFTNLGDGSFYRGDFGDSAFYYLPTRHYNKNSRPVFTRATPL